MNSQLITRHYQALLKCLGIAVASCSAISSGLLWAAAPPDGLRVLDPVATKATLLTLLAVLGVILPLISALIPRQYLRFIATVFAAAAMTNAVVLSPMIVVPFQDATSFIAVIGAIGMAVASVPALHEPVEDPENSGTEQA
ncbi:hypothetical protein [Arthrobacter sp. AZCC_0090]|uniref:hypothetical protein n=1 Tax=Arthrobacter sp. AZCC_0090 TaxID=2735881 RepID=UPI0016131C77|nr:hypothetical protein [Arthrobacter sp. AZCC_0090]MBB6407217.1 hypothetical protein [Arthrobacter sp. AZCC_0090]